MKPEKGIKLNEGKTKIIWSVSNQAGDVLIESKDDITAGDGARKDFIQDKGVIATTTTCNVFQFLNSKNIPTHFIDRVDERTFRAVRVDMIPIEIVARRIATGSYLKRNPDIQEGTRFDRLVFEFFLKDDANHDPLIIWNQKDSVFHLFDPRKPISAGPIRTLPHLFSEPQIFPSDLDEMSFLSRMCFVALEEAWEELGVSLVDFKIECGIGRQSPNHGDIIVADVIDNDSWRIWPDGNKAKMKDKQVYRNLEVVTLEALASIRDNYQWVAEATSHFK